MYADVILENPAEDFVKQISHILEYLRTHVVHKLINAWYISIHWLHSQTSAEYIWIYQEITRYNFIIAKR